MKSTFHAFLVSLAAVLLLLGCKEGMLGPDLHGSIHGQVMNFETGDALAGASVTTAPPTSAIVTDSDGRFQLDDVPEGNYTLTAKKSGFRPSTVTISVRENRVTPAVVFLEPGDGTQPPPEHSLDVQLMSWHNQVQNDSTHVFVEYRVQNTGSTAVNAYEVYFRIITDGPTYFEQRSGGLLQPGQIEVRNFERYIFQQTATLVEIDTFWVAP